MIRGVLLLLLGFLHPLCEAADTIQVGTHPIVQGVISPPVADGKHPLVLLLGGLETGQKAIELIPHPPNVALASLDYPFRLDQKFTAATVIKRGLELRAALRAVDQNLCEFLDRASKNPRVDPQRIILVGASFGAPYAMAAASRCGGVKALILLQGFGDVPGTLASRMQKSLSRKIGGWAEPVSRILGWVGWQALGLRSPEALAASIDPRIPVLWVEASEDDLIPDSSKKALVAAFAGHPAFERQVMPGAHLRPGNLQQIEDLFRRSLQWLSAKGIYRRSR